LPIYNKLVRDKIPAIVEQNGKRANYTVLGQAEYVDALRQKFTEEWAEYVEAANAEKMSPSQAVEELADLLEILYSLARIHGADEHELHRVCQQKREERGGFSERIWLVEVRDEQSGTGDAKSCGETDPRN
jgi:predicted house-cleaning noncanonical NTP pyrophosphatase (MazG superfamily)